MCEITTCITCVQNVDTLERLAGIPEEKLVEAHGSFARVKGTRQDCGKECSAEEVNATYVSTNGRTIQSDLQLCK